MSAGSSTIVSPASASTSESSHSSVLNGQLREGRLVGQQPRAALDLPARDDRRVPEPREPRLVEVAAGRTRRAARTARRSAGRSASGRAGRCAARRPCGPRCGRARRAARARTSTARPTRVVGPLVALLQVLDLDDATLLDGVGERAHELLLGIARRLRSACGAGRTARTSPRASSARGRAACAPRPRSSGRRSRSRGGSRAPRAASASAACRKTSP